MLKKIGIGLIVLIIFVLMIWFAYINPGVVSIDLAVRTVEPTIAVAFAVTFVLGWIFGLLCTTVFILRLMNERRQLRKSLRYTEAEVSSLRNLPLSDAD